jgi:hypothetical protein
MDRISPPDHSALRSVYELEVPVTATSAGDLFLFHLERLFDDALTFSALCAVTQTRNQNIEWLRANDLFHHIHVRFELLKAKFEHLPKESTSLKSQVGRALCDVVEITARTRECAGNAVQLVHLMLFTSLALLQLELAGKGGQKFTLPAQLVSIAESFPSPMFGDLSTIDQNARSVVINVHNELQH